MSDPSYVYMLLRIVSPAYYTFAGLNNNDQIVGSYNDSAGVDTNATIDGFIDTNGTIDLISDPSADLGGTLLTTTQLVDWLMKAFFLMDVRKA